MRLSFPNGEHPDHLLESGELSIGAAAGNGVVLPAAGLAPRHVVIRLDHQRGVLMSVPDRAAQVHVNARPVREQALLRLGDVLSLNRLQILLKPDRDELIDQHIPEHSASTDGVAQRTAASRVVLRGVSGDYFGRSICLRDPVEIGRSATAQIHIDDPDVGERHAQVELHGERILLRDLGSGDGSVVNGVAVRNAVLHQGDQIAVAGQRFVLEAPGTPPRGTSSSPAAGSGMGNTQTMPAIRTEPSQPAAAGPGVATGRSNVGWLIVTALAIAAAIVALLTFAPR